MYSGKRKKDAPNKKPAAIPPLVQLASQWKRDNLAALKRILSYVPDELLDTLLVGCSPAQLEKIEEYSSRDLSSVTEELWKFHCINFPDYQNETFGTWKETYMHMVEQYEAKKLLTGKKLRGLYDEEAKERASKKIKVLQAAPMSTSRSRSSGGVGCYSKPSKLMEKCLKDMKKSQSIMPWKKPPTVTVTKLVTPTVTQPSKKPMVQTKLSFNHANIPTKHVPKPINNATPKLVQNNHMAQKLAQSTLHNTTSTAQSQQLVAGQPSTTISKSRHTPPHPQAQTVTSKTPSKFPIPPRETFVKPSKTTLHNNKAMLQHKRK